MIEDTCRCGATFRVKRNSIYSELETHERWLDAHAVCRKPKGYAIPNLIARTT